MARVGRKPQGWKLIDRLSADEASKARLKAILRTLSGECRVEDACQELGIEQSRFFALRNKWLEEAAGLLAPKPAGRPAKPPEPPAEPPQVRDLKEQLMAAELRAKLAEAGLSRTSRERRKKGAPR